EDRFDEPRMLVVVRPVDIDGGALDGRRGVTEKQLEPGGVGRRGAKVEPFVARIPDAARRLDQYHQVDDGQRRADEVIDEVAPARGGPWSEPHRESASKQTWVPPPGALTRNSTSAVPRARRGPNGISNAFQKSPGSWTTVPTSSPPTTSL